MSQWLQAYCIYYLPSNHPPSTHNDISSLKPSLIPISPSNDKDIIWYDISKQMRENQTGEAYIAVLLKHLSCDSDLTESINSKPPTFSSDLSIIVGSRWPYYFIFDIFSSIYYIAYRTLEVPLISLSVHPSVSMYVPTSSVLVSTPFTLRIILAFTLKIYYFIFNI